MAGFGTAAADGDPAELALRRARPDHDPPADPGIPLAAGVDRRQGRQSPERRLCRGGRRRRALLAARDPGSVGEAYNITSHCRITQREFLDMLADALGVPRVTWHYPFWYAFYGGFSLEIRERLLLAKKPPRVTRYGAWLLGRYLEYSTEKARDEARLGPGPFVIGRAIERTSAGSWKTSPRGCLTTRCPPWSGSAHCSGASEGGRYLRLCPAGGFAGVPGGPRRSWPGRDGRIDQGRRLSATGRTQRKPTYESRLSNAIPSRYEALPFFAPPLTTSWFDRGLAAWPGRVVDGLAEDLAVVLRVVPVAWSIPRRCRPCRRRRTARRPRGTTSPGSICRAGAGAGVADRVGARGEQRPSVPRAAISHWASVGSFLWAHSAYACASRAFTMTMGMESDGSLLEVFRPAVGGLAAVAAFP